MTGWIKLERQRFYKFKSFEADLGVLIDVWEKHPELFKGEKLDKPYSVLSDSRVIDGVFKFIRDRSDNIPKTAILMGIDYPIERHAVVFLCADDSFPIQTIGAAVPIEYIITTLDDRAKT